MILTLQTRRLQTLDEVRRFLSGNEEVDFLLLDRDSAYEFIVQTFPGSATARCGGATRARSGPT